MSCKAAEDSTAWTASDLLSIPPGTAQAHLPRIQSTGTCSHIMITPERACALQEPRGTSGVPNISGGVLAYEPALDATAVRAIADRPPCEPSSSRPATT